MPFSTGPIENVGNQPTNANRARVKILNRTAGPLTGVVRSFRLDGTRRGTETILGMRGHSGIKFYNIFLISVFESF